MKKIMMVTAVMMLVGTGVWGEDNPVTDCEQTGATGTMRVTPQGWVLTDFNSGIAMPVTIDDQIGAKLWLSTVGDSFMICGANAPLISPRPRARP